MADTKFSALTAVGTVASTDELGVNQGGVSKKASVAQVRQSVGTLPTVVSVGAEFTGTGAPTATLPGTHATNDILVLCLQSSNENIATPAGYTKLGPENGIGIAVTAGSVRLAVFWKRDGGSESAPTIADSGDHTYGMMFAVRGCPTVGDPYRMLGQAWKFTASTTGTADAGATRTPNSLVVNIFAHAIDSATAQASSPANASLTNVTEQFDDATTDGTGGGIVIISGTAATPGDVVGTTLTWAASTVDVSTTISFVPADSFPMSRGPETEMFIGSPPDLDDIWTRPFGARKVFVQICDGGGGGSSGHTVTTAEGGGGGGGGGYDEAWFEAEDFGATVTVHAGKGGAATTAAVDQAGNPGVLSEFDKGGAGPLTSAYRIAGTAATAAASADGGNGGGGSGRGTTAPAVNTTRADLWAVPAANSIPASGGGGGRGGSGTTTNVAGSPGEEGGGGGESGADTDAGVAAGGNGYSLRGAGGGGGGRTTGTISAPGRGGGAAITAATVGTNGTDATRLPYGASGGASGNSTTGPGGSGGFPGGGGGGGGGNIAGTQGGRGGHGIVVVTTMF